MTGNTRDLRVLLASRYPLILARTRDETHLMGLVFRAASTLGLPVWTWSLTAGLRKEPGGSSVFQSQDPDQALRFVEDQRSPGVFVFRDLAEPMRDPVVLRRLKDIAQAARPGITLVVTVASGEVPAELEGVGLAWEHLPPTREEMTELVTGLLAEFSARKLLVELTEPQVVELVDACLGLSAADAGRLIQQAASDDGKLDAGDVERARTAKAELLASSGPLELISTTAGDLAQVGGLEKLKEWLGLRGKAFQPEARAFGLEAPRGVLLTGVPGCGKSLVARTLARTWAMPLLLFDPARLYGPYVGESEERLREALASAEAMAPAVLWIDEIEKGLASGSETDSGVSKRLLGTFLRWMQDRPDGVFIVATSNDVRALPPELLRKGRFDEIFFVDLPTADDRALIFGLHLSRRKRDPSAFDLSSLAAASEGFSGSEIEACIVGALYRAFGAGSELTTEAVLREVGGTIPLSKTRAEDIARLREWASGRAVDAS